MVTLAVGKQEINEQFDRTHRIESIKSVTCRTQIFDDFEHDDLL